MNLKHRVLTTIIIKTFCVCPVLAAPESYSGTIQCYSDSAEGKSLAESAAAFLASKNMDVHYNRSFVVTGLSDEDYDYLLILILSSGGEDDLHRDSQPYRKVLTELIKNLRSSLKEKKLSVVIQKADKTNVLEATTDSKGDIKISELQKSE